MAPQSGRRPPDLKSLLRDEGWRFNFYQAVRLMQLMEPESTPVGTGDHAEREPVRFSSRITLSFPASDVHEITAPPPSGGPAGMIVNFIGVASPMSYGSLPLPYTDLALTLKRNKISSLADFLDVFNHRLISLFYRAWEKYRYAVGYERAGRKQHGLVEKILFSVMGLGTDGLLDPLAVNGRALLARAHALGGRGISALGLTSLIQDYFRVPARVQQFIPAWYDIEAGEVCRLGRQSSNLGEDICLGSRTRMAQSRFRVCLGPLTWAQAVGFLPDGSAFGSLAEVCALVGGPEFDFEFRLQLASGCTPPLRLGTSGEHGPPRLGWSTWFKSSDGGDRPAEVTINGELAAAEFHLSA